MVIVETCREAFLHTGKLVIVDWKSDKEKFRMILEENMLETPKDLRLRKRV